MDDESSKNSYSDDYEEEEDENYEDDEGTLEEEEAMPKDDENELNELQAESEMSIEELRRKYYGELASESTSVQVTSSMRISSSRRNRGTGISLEAAKAELAEVVVEIADSTEPGPSTLLAADKGPSELTYFTAEMLRDDEPDEEYKPPEWWKKTIRVGKMYQAQIPAMLSDEEVGVSGEEDRSVPVWKPIPQLTDEKIDRYLLDFYAEAKQEAVKENHADDPAPPKVVPDDEDALYSLFQENYNIRLTHKRTMIHQVINTVISRKANRIVSERANAPQITYRGPWKPFTNEEVALFEEGLRTNGKKFSLVQANCLPMRNVGELVQFYYTWKKTERYDMFIKCQVPLREDPNSTDYMESLADQIDQSNQIVTSSTSVSQLTHAASSSAMVTSSTDRLNVKFKNGTLNSRYETSANNLLGSHIENSNKHM